MSYNRRANLNFVADGNGKPVFADSYKLYPYQRGGVVTANSTSTFIALDTGNKFSAGDKFLKNPGSDNSYSISGVIAQSTSGILMDLSFTVVTGDILFNLEADSSVTSTPNYDGSTVSAYTRPDAGGAITFPIEISSIGEYSYFTTADEGQEIWELLQTSTSVVSDYNVNLAKVVSFSGLQDVAGTYTSGLSVRFDGTNFQPVNLDPIYQASGSYQAAGNYETSGTSYTKAESNTRFLGISSSVHNVKDYGAVGDNSTDDLNAFGLAISGAKNGNGYVYIPSGTYKLTNELIAPCNMIGAGSQSVSLRFTVSSANSRLVKCNSIISAAHQALRTSPRAEQLSDPPLTTYAAIDVQDAGLSYVTCSTAGDAANFSKDDWIKVAAGKNYFDADDWLWRYESMHRITDTDAGTGKVWLDSPVDLAISGDNFASGVQGAAGSQYYTTDDWVNSTAYSVGNLTYGSGIWECTSGGTSNGTWPSDDSGVEWAPRVNDLGALRTGRRDQRPLIQKVETPVHDIIHKGFTIYNDSAVDVVIPHEVKSVANMVIEDVVASEGTGGKSFQVGLGASEGSRNITYLRCSILDTSTSFYRFAGGYNGRDVKFIECHATAGGYTDSTNPFIYLEGYSSTLFDKCMFSRRNPHSTFDGRFIQCGGGCDVSISNTTAIGFDTPFRAGGSGDGLGINNEQDAEDHVYLGRVIHCKGNIFTAHTTTFRPSLWGFTDLGQLVGNRFIVDRGLDTGQTAVSFDASRIVVIEDSFTPTGGSANVIMASSLSEKLSSHYIVLGMEVFATGLGGSDYVNVNGRRYNTVGYNRLFAKAGVDDNNKIRVTAASTYGRRYNGLGDASRLFVKDYDYLAYSHDSNNTAGTVYVKYICLECVDMIRGRSDDTLAAAP